jgi:hypothetical protein
MEPVVGPAGPAAARVRPSLIRESVMSTVRITRPSVLHGAREKRTATEPGRLALMAGGVFALVALPVGLVALSLLLP